jgi:hypothetical protein
MYLPMLFEAKTTAPTYANFKSLLQQYPNKLVLIGNEPNDVNQGNTTPAEFAAAIDDLHTVSPNMQWIGPNIIFPFATPGNENNLNTTLGWCNAYHNLIVARPDRKPTRWSFHIYAENTVKWNEYWTMLCQWMIAHNYKVNSYTPTPVVLTETSLSRPDATLAEQQTLLSIISALMNRAASPLAQTFIYCASDDSPHGTLDEYSNNELMQPSGAVYAYRTLGTTWDALARWLYSTVPPRRPWPAPARAPATVRAARPILSPSL